MTTIKCENECESEIIFKLTFLGNENLGHYEYFCPICMSGILTEVPEIIKLIERIEVK